MPRYGNHRIVIEDDQDTAQPNFSTAKFVFAAVAIELSLGVAALVAGRVTGTDPLATARWSWTALAAGAAASVPPLIGMRAMWRSPLEPLVRIRRILEFGLLRDLATLSVLELTILAAAAGIGEELLFRGFLQALLESHLGPVLGLSLASVIFGLAHPITVFYFMITAAMGAYLGLVWWATGNLLAPVVAHALYDFLAILWMRGRRTDRRA